MAVQCECNLRKKKSHSHPGVKLASSDMDICPLIYITPLIGHPESVTTLHYYFVEDIQCVCVCDPE